MRLSLCSTHTRKARGPLQQKIMFPKRKEKKAEEKKKKKNPTTWDAKIKSKSQGLRENHKE